METLAPRLFTVLTKAVRALGEHARRHIDGLELGLSDFAVLEALLHKGPLTIGALGEKVLLTSGSMTAAVDRLARKQLVERKPIAGDRRARLVQLTPAGRRLIERAYAQHTVALDAAVAGLSRTEQKQLLELARRLGLAAQATVPAPPISSSRASRTVRK